MATTPAFAALRASIAAVEHRRGNGVLSLGDRALDSTFPHGGLALGAWHEIGGAGMETEICAAPAAFAVRIAATLANRGEVVWVLRRDDLYAPGLSTLGFPAERLIQVCAVSDDQAFAVLEEALSTPGVAAAVAEAEAVSLVAGRRLQLACEKTGAMGLVLRRRPWGGARKSERPGSGAFSRWQVKSAPSEPAPGAPGLGLSRWGVELLRCRGGQGGAWMIEEAPYGPHPFRLVAEVGDQRVEAPLRLTG